MPVPKLRSAWWFSRLPVSPDMSNGDFDYEEIVTLQASPEVGVSNSVTMIVGAPSMTLRLWQAVRIVVERFGQIQRMTAMIHRNSGPSLQQAEILAIYERPDFRSYRSLELPNLPARGEVGNLAPRPRPPEVTTGGPAPP